MAPGPVTCRLYNLQAVHIFLHKRSECSSEVISHIGYNFVTFLSQMAGKLCSRNKENIFLGNCETTVKLDAQ